MMRLVCLHLFPASRASELVVAGVGVAEPYFRLYVPMVTEYPRVAVCHACADKPALIAGIFQFPRVGAQEFDFPVYSADIVLSAMHVRAKKMPAETVAQPVTDLGL